jgi:hypothetical protein
MDPTPPSHPHLLSQNVRGHLFSDVVDGLGEQQQLYRGQNNLKRHASTLIWPLIDPAVDPAGDQWRLEQLVPQETKPDYIDPYPYLLESELRVPEHGLSIELVRIFLQE